MSIKVMSAIFETEFRDLPLPPEEGREKSRMARASSLKLVLLAIADHANDEGESAYPGLTKLETKTGMSRQGVVDVISALKYNGLLVISETPSKLGTNNYTLNLGCFPCLHDASQITLLVKPLDYPSQATLPEVVKPLDSNHPFTTHEPITHTPAEKPDFVNLTVVEAAGIPEIRIFSNATGIHPGVGQLETIWQTIRDMRAAGRPVTADRLRPFWLAWNARGYNVHSLNWLTDWAVSGKIPEQKQNGGTHAKSNPTNSNKNMV